MPLIAHDVQSTLGRQFLAPLRDQARIGGFQAAGDRAHRGGRGHLQVHAGLQDLPQHLHVSILDMSAVLAQMQSDGIRASLFGHQGRLDRLGIPSAPRLTDGGDMIDIDAQ